MRRRGGAGPREVARASRSTGTGRQQAGASSAPRASMVGRRHEVTAYSGCLPGGAAHTQRVGASLWLGRRRARAGRAAQ